MSTSWNADQLPDDLPADPMRLAQQWIDEASTAASQPHANAMTLATVSADGQPSTRIVLCKEFVADPGYLVFYTNYESRKSSDLSASPRAAVQFHWDAAGRQIRIEGIAVRSPAEESDRYFASRDRGSQLGAWGSDQSAEIGSRAALIAQIRTRAQKLGITPPDEDAASGTDQPCIARPPHWGGFRLWAARVELWREGADRIHERALWRRQLERESGDRFSTTAWKGALLQP